MRLPGFIFVALFMGLGCTTSTPVESAESGDELADLVLTSGKIATVDESFSIQNAVAVRGDRIIFVGDQTGAEALIGPETRVLTLEGCLVLPGLIDAHAHLHSLGEELTFLKVTGTSSYGDIIELVAERVKSSQPGEWIRGGRWDQNDWADKSFPVHGPLSAVSPDNPVYLSRVDGNSAFVNGKALELAGIDDKTPDPPGGVIVRDSQGKATGVLVNQAMNLVKGLLPVNDEHELRRKFLMAVDSCLKFGLTGVHEAGVGPVELDLYKKLIDEKRLPLRLYAMIGEQEKPVLTGNIGEFLKAAKIINYGGEDYLTARAVKLFFDGALGSRGAAFFEPYTDDPENIGLLRVTPEYIYNVTRAALQNGMHVGTHCIGIRGNRLCLEAYERALREVPVKDHRLRIEHAQIVRKEDVDLFARLGVLPAMQPTHCTSDMTFVADRVGEARARGAYAWRWFRDAGLPIPCGSDFPVESNNPLLGIYAAVTRQDPDGEPENGWFPEQRLTLEEAIRGFTIWAAYGSFQENILGSIEEGKLADFTILDRDILSLPPAEILTARVRYTIVGGKIRYASE